MSNNHLLTQKVFIPEGWLITFWIQNFIMLKIRYETLYTRIKCCTYSDIPNI